MAKTLDDARTLLLEAAKLQPNNGATPSSERSFYQQDEALQVGLHDFVRRTRCVRATFVQPISANTWMEALTAGTSPVPADWVRERTVGMTIRYNNTGAWSSVTSYNVFDMAQNVSGDGLWYACLTANSNSQPPNGNWRQVTFDTIAPVILTSEAAIRDYHGCSSRGPRGCGDAAECLSPYRGWVEAAPRTGLPCAAAFRDDSTLVFWPYTKQAVNMAIQYWQPFTTWTLGVVPTGSPLSTGVTLNVPMDYVDEAIVKGAADMLLFNTPGGRIPGSAAYEALVKEVMGTYNVDSGRISRSKPGIYV